MRVLVIGQGGREHSLVKALHFSASVAEVHCAPGNSGMREAICHDVSHSDTEAILGLCEKFSFDLVVIGPEQPLVNGLADQLRERNIATFGPSKESAQLEASKIFNKEFLNTAGIPTAKSVVVKSVEQTLEAASAFTPPYVLKADGLAAGKGVYICDSLVGLESAAKQLFVDKVLGSAGEAALLEQFQPGYEMSYFILTDGKNAVSLPLAQDHKRIGEGETGPNTGGMGTVAPVIPTEFVESSIQEKVIQPTLNEFQRRGMDYRGVLFIGLMMTEEGPQVLEFNVRFGDPETQVLLPLLKGDWGQALLSVAKGELPELSWSSLSACCVVLASPGYPESSTKGLEIEGDVFSQSSSSYFVHAGTRNQNSKWETNGGRVLNAIGIGADVEEAINNAYAQAQKVKWQGLQYRKDIGKKLPPVAKR